MAHWTERDEDFAWAVLDDAVLRAWHAAGRQGDGKGAQDGTHTVE